MKNRFKANKNAYEANNVLSFLSVVKCFVAKTFKYCI